MISNRPQADSSQCQANPKLAINQAHADLKPTRIGPKGDCIPNPIHTQMYPYTMLVVCIDFHIDGQYRVWVCIVVFWTTSRLQVGKSEEQLGGR